MARPTPVAAEMPFRRVEHTVEGVRLSAIDDGPRDARETLLFLHGNPTWSYAWRHLLAPCIRDGHRVVAPDQAGFGHSDKPTDPGYYTYDRHVDNLTALARHLDLRDVTLVVHDWGGPVGLAWAVANPERVKRIVITNTTAFPPRRARPLSTWHKVFSSDLGYEAAVRFNLVARSAFRFGVNEKLDAPTRRAYLWPLREKGGRIAAARFVQLVPDHPDDPVAERLRGVNEAFPKLSGRPVLVLWADKDPVFPAKLAAKWEGCGLDVVGVHHVSRKAGHFWQEDDPEAFLTPIRVFAKGGT